MPYPSTVQPTSLVGWRTRVTLHARRLRQGWQVFAESHLALAGLAPLALFALLAIAHPLLRATIWREAIYDPITGFDPREIHPAPPSRHHLLGTDVLGRDVLSMLLAATGPAFTVGITAALSSAAIGLIVGTAAAYVGGRTDRVLMHFSDAFLLLPPPLLMVIVGMRFREIGPGTLGLVYGLVAGAGGTAIVMRSYALTVVCRPFVEAARASGSGTARILTVHILPHLLPLVGLHMLLTVTGAVVADVFISFFGFSRGYLTWGTLIYSSFVYSSYLGADVEWRVLVPPSLALSFFASAFYLIAIGIQRVVNPRLR